MSDIHASSRHVYYIFIHIAIRISMTSHLKITLSIRFPSVVLVETESSRYGILIKERQILQVMTEVSYNT